MKTEKSIEELKRGVVGLIEHCLNRSNPVRLSDNALQMLVDIAEILGKRDDSLRLMTMDRDGWKREFNTYRRAWIRELGGTLVPKTHDIDSLVLTTRKRLGKT